MTNVTIFNKIHCHIKKNPAMYLVSTNTDKSKTTHIENRNSTSASNKTSPPPPPRERNQRATKWAIKSMLDLSRLEIAVKCHTDL